MPMRRRSFFLFILFYGIGTYIMLDMFIAVILDHFTYIYEDDDEAITRNDLRNLKEAWRRFDPKSKGYMDVADVPKLLFSLTGPFTVRLHAEPAWKAMARQRFAADFYELCRVIYKPGQDGKGHFSNFSRYLPAATTPEGGAAAYEAEVPIAERVLSRYSNVKIATRGIDPKAAARWRILFERFLAPRLVAFFLRRAYRLREPQRKARIANFISSELGARREAEALLQEQKLRQEFKAKQTNYNMVR